MISPPSAPTADRWRAYRAAAGHVPQLALATLGIALLMGACAWLLGEAHGRRTAFHDALDVLLHYPAALSGIMAFTGASLLALATCLLLYPFAFARWLLGKAVVPALQTAEHMLSLALGLYLAWVTLHADDAGIAGITSIRGIAASALALLIVAGVAVACSAVLTWVTLDLPRQHAQRSRGALLGLMVLVLAAGWMYVDLVWLYDPVDAAH